MNQRLGNSVILAPNWPSLANALSEISGSRAWRAWKQTEARALAQLATKVARQESFRWTGRKTRHTQTGRNES